MESFSSIVTNFFGLSNMPIFLAIAASLVALIYGLILMLWLVKLPTGTPKMMEIAQAIQEGAEAYLKRQYTIIFGIAIVLFVVLWLILGQTTALGFAVGAIASSIAGFAGMNTSVRANIRTTEAAKSGLAKALNVAFKGGAFTGLMVVGLGLLSVTGFYALTGDIKALVGLGFGGSLISVFARLGGGIYTKGADVGTDMVGKIEAGIPEDDPRNPGVIADNVGDNVGDCAGMAADLFETYAVTLIAAILLGSLVFPGFKNALVFPLVLGAVSIICCIIGTFFVHLPKSKNIMNALYEGLIISALLSAIIFYPVTIWLMSGNGGYIVENLYWSALLGLVVTIGMVVSNE